MGYVYDAIRFTYEGCWWLLQEHQEEPYTRLETLEEAELPSSEKGLNILEDYYLKKIENYKTAISCDVGNIQINESDIKYEIHGSIFSTKTRYFMILWQCYYVVSTFAAW